MKRFTKWFAALAAAAVLNTAAVRADDKPDTRKEDKKPDIDPKDVRVGPPPELAELRKAVEDAARKGENVEEIRKQLDALEKALAGKAWVKPKLVAEPPPPVADPPRFPRPQPMPLPPQFNVDPKQAEMLQKVQELMLKAALLRPDDAEGAEKLLKEARELMGKMPGGLLLPPPIFDVRPMAPRGAGSRLGILVEKVPDAVIERFNLPENRGVLAAEIVPGSPAEKAGIQANDVITEFAGKPVGIDPTEFVRTVRAMKPGEKVDLVYYRKGKKAEAKGIVLADLDNRRGGLDLPGAPFVPVPDLTALLPLGVPPARVPAAPPPPVPAAPGAKSKSVSVQVQNGAFTIDAEEDGAKFAIEGTVADNKPVPNKIKVTSGKRVVDAESVEKLPAEFRDSVQKILDSVKLKSAK